jgi:hypothetical protein
MHPAEYTDYPAIIHAHSTYSDGSRDIPDIARIASEVGIKFLMMTDHNNLRAVHDGHNRWYGDVLVDIGYEINDSEDRNHYLAFGLEHEVNRQQRARDYVREVAANGGFGFLAHPHEERRDLPGFGIYPWTDWEAEDYTGIEVWNHMSSWMEGLSSRNRIWRFIHPRQSVWAPAPKTLFFWDELAGRRRITGIGGADAHGFRYKILGNLSVEVFRYKIIFKCLRTYILLKENKIDGLPWKEASALLHGALKNANVYFAQYYLGDPSGFRFWAEKKDKTFNMGKIFNFEKGIRLKAVIPQKKINWILFRDGQSIQVGKERKIDQEIKKPGVYRLEIYLKKRPWLYSNHLYVRGETE